MFDMTADEVLDALADWHRFDFAEQRNHLARIAAGASPDYEHWKCWSEAAAFALFMSDSDPEILNYIKTRTPDMDEIMAALLTLIRNEL